jgi:hypothetical protein
MKFHRSNLFLKMTDSVRFWGIVDFTLLCMAPAVNVRPVETVQPERKKGHAELSLEE